MTMTRSRAAARHLAALAFLGAASAALAFAGCGGGHAESICRMSCDCSGCSAVDFDTCVKTISDSEKVSADVGCAGEADTFESCADARGSCLGSLFVIGGCDIERNAFTGCLARSNCTLGLLGDVHCS